MTVFTELYLNRAGLVFMIFSVGLQVIDVNGRQARDEQLQLLFCEDGDESLGDDLVEPLKEGCQLFADCA